jgi:hypothetical protein
VGSECQIRSTSFAGVPFPIRGQLLDFAPRRPQSRRKRSLLIHSLIERNPVMKPFIAAAIVLAGATLASAPANAQAAGNSLRPCTARVVYSEELPFAPIDSWLVKVTLEITPQKESPYYTTLQNRMPWQGPPPRRGQAFQLLCDPDDLHPIARPARSSF